MRLSYLLHYFICSSGFNTAIGYPPCGMKDYILVAFILTGFNTAIGYHPMRPVRGEGVHQFTLRLQYRNRVSPHAALSYKEIAGTVGMLQYRNRVSPHAAFWVCIYPDGTSALQYRNRVSPHAATMASNTANLAFMLQYRKRISPNAARKPIVCINTKVSSSNTAKGSLPMRLMNSALSKLPSQQLQYRNRVSPHAAPERWYRLKEDRLLQYRNRVSPHAACY